MSELSEKLEYYMEAKGLNLAELSKRSRIDRSTVYQYLKGKRPLRSWEQFQQITAPLLLTPEERSELEDAFEIARIGRIRFLRRQKVGEIIHSLFTIEQYPEYFREESAGTIPESGSVVIQGELEVSRAIRWMVKNTCQRGGKRMDILLQPDCEMSMSMLYMLHDYVMSDLEVRQIICLDTNQGGDGCYNLDAVQKVLRCGIAIKNYQALYYYGNVSQHFGSMNVLPYLFSTDILALMVAADGKSALLFADENTVGYLGERFQRMASRCCPLMEGGGLMKQWRTHGNPLVENYINGNIYEITSGVCTSQFWNEALIRRYLNPRIADYERFLAALTTYTGQLYEGKKQGHVTVLMNRDAVQEFIRTGVMREYPQEYFTGALNVADRRYLLERMIAATQEGWYHIRLMRGEQFPLSDRWEIIANQGKQVFIQYSIRMDFQMFDLRETDVSEAFFDYLEHLCEREDVLDDEASVALLREWTEKELKS